MGIFQFLFSSIKFCITKRASQKHIELRREKHNLLLQLALLFTSLIIFFFLWTGNFTGLKGTGLILIFYKYNCSYS